MTPTLDGRRTPVTGGAGEIALARVRRLAADGARVTVADLNGPAATAVAREVGPTDVAALAEISSDCDALVKNAAFRHAKAIVDGASLSMDGGWSAR